MFFTGFTRFSSDVQKANKSSSPKDKNAMLKEMQSLVDDAEHILIDRYSDLDDFGRLLDHTWKLKRGTGAAVTTDKIDYLYAKGIEAGALGGKLLGAGREKKTDDIDYGVGVFINKKTGEAVKAGETLCTIYSNDEKKTQSALKYCKEAFTLSDTKPVVHDLIYEIIK